MGLHCISSKISKNFAWELGFLYFIRKFSDGVTLFELSIDASFYKGDHNPQFGIKLMVLNFMVFEFRIYNVHHVEEDDV